MSSSSWLRNARGEWYVVAQFALLIGLFAAPAFDGRPFSWSRSTAVAGAVLCLVGLGFVVLGSIGLGRRNLSPFPKPKDEGMLIKSGIFSVVRHPIYSGFVLFALGWSLVWSSAMTLIAALLLLVFFDVKARREEGWLQEKFPDYHAYRLRVKKLIPFLY
jgi:protein-S-isoprenylcysteine O-methyltransferase Ste14